MKVLGALLCVLLIGCGGGNKPTTGPGPTGGGGGDTTTTDTTNTTDTTTTTDTTATQPATPKSLYDRLGGLPAIEAVVKEFVGRTTTDPRIKDRFFNTDGAELTKLLIEFVCMATGGPCKYTGRSMEDSHGGMDIVDDEWTALVENLVGALDKFKVPEKEKGELLGALGPLKPAIVTPADKLKPIEANKLAQVTKLQATVKDKQAAELLGMAVVAGQRGQRNYAEQLFTRAELIVGPKALAKVSTVFRAGAPTRIATPTKKLEDKGAQPAVVGSSEADEPDAKPARGQLTGMLVVDGKAPQGLGVVMMWPANGKGKKRTPKARVVEQRNKQFAPRVTAVPVGSTVSFPNFDPIFHNVFSLSKVKPFDLGMYKSGETREVKLDKPGIVRLGCNLHAAMSAYLVVVDAPHYVVVEPNGKFAFKSLAPGKYKVQAWNERSAEPTVSEVTIKEGGNEVTLDLKGGAKQTPSPDKFGTSRAAP